MTLAELARHVETLERRQATFEDRMVLQAVYTRDMNEIRNDLAEIKDSQRWAMRLIAAEFVALVVALLVFAIQRLPT